MDDITKTQRSFAVKASANRQHRFADLYHLICKEEWLIAALDAVLDNTGSRTAGIDGVTRKHLADEDARARFVAELQADLKAGKFRPDPVRRHYIPKGEGKVRPLGIPTIRSRVVQMLLKMLLEPIWEADFLDCSNGFRPGRRTMDCIAPLYGYFNSGVKAYWVVEGDIWGCFEHIHHKILLRLVEKRVADRRILTLIGDFLQAGVMEGAFFKRTEEGTPQGGIVSPLLANIYLHELDRYWWEHYGGLSPWQKRQRRNARLGNPLLLRYADDFILLTNGPREEAYRLREEFRHFLAEELRLELSLEKTAVTHVNDGFDFLGFHIRRYLHPKGGGKPVVLVKPSKKNIERLKARVRDMTGRHRGLDNQVFKVAALNRVLRWWAAYYRHANAKAVLCSLDFWVEKRLACWLCEKHRCGIRRVLREYQHRQGGRKNLAVKTERGELMFLYRMGDLPLTRYPLGRRENPYLHGVTPTLAEPNSPIPARAWNGGSRFSSWKDVQLMVLERDGYRCQNPDCGASDDLDVHHKQWRKKGGDDDLANLTTLCVRCHKAEQRGGLTVNW